MKKWFVGLLMMAMALVMIPSVVMAETEVSFYCPSCCEQRTGIKSDTYEYFDQNTHRQRITCKVCNYKGMSVSSAHTETKAATCQSAAYCADCKSYYGSKAEHNWGDWTTDEKTHKRTCQTPGCGAVDTGSHTSEPRATCKTEQMCAICNVQYQDLENHEGEVLTRYSFLSEYQHKLNQFCSSCGDVIFGDNEAHTETTAATCQSAAYCADCKSYYGSKAEHNWGAWSKSDENQHVRTCQTSGCDAVQYAAHTGGGATCIKEGTCTDCGASYKDPNKHEGESRTSYQSVSDTEHKVMVICSSCREATSAYNESHVEFFPANCLAGAMCGRCWVYYGDPDPDNHVREATTTYVKTSETQHTAKITYAGCEHTVDGASTDHTETTAATCSAGAYCGVCESNYGDPDPDAHDLVQHDAQAPTCTEIGWNAYEACQREGCGYTTYSALDVNPNNHVGTPTTTYVKTSETQHTERIKYSDCGHTIDGASADHTETTAATCTVAAYCDVCKSSYGDPDPDAHNLVQHDAQAPTCFHVGWNAYEACQREGCGYTTYVAKGTLVHWYGEWTPNADGTHSATCRYGCGYRRTVPCACFTYQLNGDPVAEYTLCPVCGEVNDGTRLTMAEGAKAAALTRTLPGGEVVVRMGVLSGGEAVMSVAFESAGCLTKPTGQVKINLPAELLEGYTLSLLAEDGTETELTFDVRKEEASFVLDFTDSPSAVRMIRLIPEV